MREAIDTLPKQIDTTVRFRKRGLGIQLTRLCCGTRNKITPIRIENPLDIDEREEELRIVMVSLFACTDRFLCFRLDQFSSGVGVIIESKEEVV